jgi:mono/diheme cytochrome c family protein
MLVKAGARRTHPGPLKGGPEWAPALVCAGPILCRAANPPRRTCSRLAVVLLTAFVIGCGGNKVDNLNDLNREMDQADAKAKPVAAAPAEQPFDAPVTPDAIAAGNTTYQKMCAPCHGVSGKGDGVAAAALNPKPRDHSNGAYMDKLTNEHLHQVITQGGAKFGYPTMPALAQLTDDDVRHVIAFVRSLSSTYKP